MAPDQPFDWVEDAVRLLHDVLDTLLPRALALAVPGRPLSAVSSKSKSLLQLVELLVSYSYSQRKWLKVWEEKVDLPSGEHLSKTTAAVYYRLEEVGACLPPGPSTSTSLSPEGLGAVVVQLVQVHCSGIPAGRGAPTTAAGAVAGPAASPSRSHGVRQ